MARPKKNNADYHSHDKDMRNNRKIKALRKKFSHVGYSVYNMMLEVLDDCDHFKHPWDELNIELLAGDFDIDAETLAEIVTYCIKLGLLSIECGFIFSFEHQNRFERLLSKRKPHNAEVSGNKTAGNSDEVTFPAVSVVENPQSKVKESIVEESRLNNSIETTIPKAEEVGTPAAAGMPATAKKTVKKNSGKKRDLPDDVQQVNDYFSEKMKGKWAPARISANANKMFDHYSANGWVQNKGKPIVSWKHAANNWIMNELNGTYGTTNGSQVHHTGPTSPPPSTQDPLEKKLTHEEKNQLSRDFLQDCYQDYCNGELFIVDSLRFYYNDLVRDGLLIISPEDKARIKAATNGDVDASKNMAVKEYFDRQKAEGVKRIYDPVGQN